MWLLIIIGLYIKVNMPSALDKPLLPYFADNMLGAWIQVDLLRETPVTGIITQGRGNDACNCDQWITSFKIHHGTHASDVHVLLDDAGNPLVSKLDGLI